MGRAAYIAVQATWGFAQTALGAAVCCVLRRRPRFRYHGAVVTLWNTPKALSLGPFIFLKGSGEALRDALRDNPDANGDLLAARAVDERLLVHEYGHTVQSLFLGPLYLLVIGAPSIVWLNAPAFRKYRHRNQVSYYSFYTERSANWLGERVLKKPSVGQALID